MKVRGRKFTIGISFILLILIILLIIIFIPKKSEGLNDNNLYETDKEPFEKNPVAKFEKEDIDFLGLSCGGNDEEIAECIFNWQLENMIYVQTAQKKEGPFLPSYEIRWQEILPGIYTSKDVLETKISSGEINSGKIYGICFEFAIVYCSIAEYYGLECRIVETKTNINEETRTGGMSPLEYESLKPWLDKYKLNYSYDVIRLTMPDSSEVAGHYWAEVNLPTESGYDNNGWRIMDASNAIFNGRDITRGYITEGEWEVVNWSSKDRTIELERLQSKVFNGEDLSRKSSGNQSDIEEFLEGREIYSEDVETGREEEYIGITDELGNENRAATIDDFMQGKALAPYMSSCLDSCDFIMGGNSCKKDCQKLDEKPAECYKSCSGEEFFIVCDYICEDSSDSEWPFCYESCSGSELDIRCDLLCWDD